MRSLRAIVLVVGLFAACRAGAPAKPAEPEMTYEAHMQEIERLDKEIAFHQDAAEVARQRGADYQCDTKPEQEQLTIGGERIVEGYRVCDDVSVADRRRHESEVKRLREEADRHRAQAGTMLASERGACAGFGVDRMRDTPLGRGRARAQVELVDGGVRVSVPVPPGTTVDEIERELACHRARAGLYDQTEYMGHDPALVTATRVDLALDGTTMVFTIHGDDAVAVEQARARAQTLAAEPR
jgi:hypothetical protein